MQNDLFISYASLDYDKVHVLGECLQNEHGFSVWMDKAKIIGQQGWRKIIIEAIDNSACLCIIVSPHSVVSDDVDTEIQLAADAKKPIFLIYLENANLSATMRYVSTGKQAVRFIDKDKIVETLNSILAKPQASPKPIVTTFPLSVQEQIAVINIQPEFVIGNGVTHMVSDRVHSPRVGWNVPIYNKGKEARNLRVRVREGSESNISCSFGPAIVPSQGAIEFFVERFNKDWGQCFTPCELLLTYEDAIGTPYSKVISDQYGFGSFRVLP